MRISEVTVLPSRSAGGEGRRRRTSTVSTSRARVASSASGTPCRKTASTARPASVTRSCARCSSSPESEARLPRAWVSRIWATTILALKRKPRWTACSNASSALGLPSRPTSRRVNTCLRQDREALQIAQAERDQLAGHREPSRQHVVAFARLETLGHHDIFGAATPQRHPQMLAGGALQSIERLGREGPVLGGGARGRGPGAPTAPPTAPPRPPPGHPWLPPPAAPPPARPRSAD